jgi:hypothetical protein
MKTGTPRITADLLFTVRAVFIEEYGHTEFDLQIPRARVTL